ncbi:MAG: hypothetical protein NC131_09725 [Roseburia sp.]|nr:hypothetical protein [Roseburia sp.]
MKSEYILLIVAGGVFALMLFIYLLYAIEKAKFERRNKEKLYKSYKPENLSKMEYDVAFYDRNVFSLVSREGERQVTIDDLLGDEAADMSQMTEASVFAQVEEGGVEEIRGNYNPSNK